MENIVSFTSVTGKRIEEIEESLYPEQDLSFEDERMIYGTFEKSFKEFSIQSSKKGNKASKIDFFKSLLKEIETIEKHISNTEKLLLEDGKTVEFHSIWNKAHSTKELINSFIQSEQDADTPKIEISVKHLIQSEDDTPKKQISKSQKRNSKRVTCTYKWLRKEDNLFALRKMLINNDLIEKIEFPKFKEIFSEIPVTKIKERIVWKSADTQLIYMIEILKNNEMLKTTYERKFDYEQLKLCFIKPNNKEFNTKNFKSLKNDITRRVNTSFSSQIKLFIKENKS